MAAGVADIGRDDETDRGAEENREAQAEEKFFPHHQRSGGSVSNAKEEIGDPQGGQGIHRPLTTPSRLPSLLARSDKIMRVDQTINDCVHSNGSVLLRVCGPKPRNR